jgi:DNA-binding transcriptional MerR regulator
MHSFFVPPRQVMIGDAAWFAATTPRAIRHYEHIGVLPEPERGSDGRRRYTQEAMLRLLWVRKMAEAGIALDDIRRAFEEPDDSSDDDDWALKDVLVRLDAELASQEQALRRKRAAVERMRSRGTRMGLLDDLVVDRLVGLPDGVPHQGHLDVLIVTQRLLGPLGAAIHAGRYVALAARPDLLEESDRLDAAEEALDDTVAVDDPRIARIARERHDFEKALEAFIDTTDQLEEDNALFASWEDSVDEHAAQVGESDERPRRGLMSAFEAMSKMPYDFSPARIRCMEIAAEIAANEAVQT